MAIVTNGGRTLMADRIALTLKDYDVFADKLAALLDRAGWRGIDVAVSADSAVIEGPLDGGRLRLHMAPGAYGVAEGWHVSKTTRTPYEG